MATPADIKLIAVDMDGTFLSDQKTFDHPRFTQQLTELNQLGIRFVVASGNQYYTLTNYFAGITDHIAYVAENGAYINDGKTLLFAADMDERITQPLFPFLNSLTSDIACVICGKESAYVLDSISEDELSVIKNHYVHVQKVAHYEDITDQILKIALKMPAPQKTAILEAAHQQLGELLTPVSSGFEYIDLIVPGVHKANGIHMLQQQWGIENHQVITFGDNNNDIEMLAHAGIGCAMAKSSPELQAVASHIIGSNNDNSVLNIIDQVILHATTHTPLETLLECYRANV